MKPVVLFRKDITLEAEFETAKKYFECVELRSEVPENSLVIGRYSCLPYYRELEKDIKSKRSVMINATWNHNYIANFDYYEDLKDHTFETWSDRDFSRCDYPGPLVVKGRTNSMKFQWNKKMFAIDKTTALNIAGDLVSENSLIAQQGIIYRKYIPLETVEIGLNGLPFAYEFRLFFYKDTLLTHGFYWSIAETVDYHLNDEGLNFAQKVANTIKDRVNFFVIDIARTKAGSWILIEVNDAQMSGLSMCDPDVLYSRLSKINFNELPQRVKDITGKRYGRLTVIGYAGKGYDNTGSAWECKCDCGKIVVKPLNIINAKDRTGSCGCLFQEMIDRQTLAPGQAGLNQYYLAYKASARRRKIDFNLTMEDFATLTSKDCHYCNYPPIALHPKKITRSCKSLYRGNGLDRVNNELGYALQNVVTCCKICNMAKSDLTQQEFEQWVARLADFQISKRTQGTT